MTEPLPDVWASRDHPVLLAAAQLLDEVRTPITSNAVAARAGIEQEAAVRALLHLGDEHLEIRDSSTYDGADCYVLGITAEGLRASGQWPTAEAAVERLLAALDAQIDGAPEGSPRASRLRAFRAGVAEVGKDLLVEVMGAVISGRIPM